MALDNLQDNAGELAGLAVLEPPRVPVDYWDYLLPLLPVLVVTVILFFVLSGYYRASHNRAKRALKVLEVQLQQQAVAEREIVFMLADILRRGLSLSVIQTGSIVSIAETEIQQRWCEFVRELSLLRYARHDPERSRVIKLFSESLFWLNQWRLFHRN